MADEVGVLAVEEPLDEDGERCLRRLLGLGSLRCRRVGVVGVVGSIRVLEREEGD